MPAFGSGGDGPRGDGLSAQPVRCPTQTASSHIERTLVFYCEDGVNTNTGTPNYQAFNADELVAITALYPAQGMTNNGGRYFPGVNSPMNCRLMSAARALIPI